MNKNMRIASVGDNCVDIYINKDNKISVGGNAINTSVAIKRSGIQCSYIGIVGNDPNGNRITEALTEEGIDISHVRVKNGATAYTKILLKNDDRIPVDEDIGVQRQYCITEQEHKFIVEHDFAHLSAFTAWPTAYGGDIENYYEVMSDIINKFKKNDVRFSLDFSDHPMEQLLEICRDKIEVGFFSRSGLNDTQIRKEAKRLMNYGFRLVVLTRGANGSCAYNGKDIFFQPIIPVKLVDPLGAGDSFIGSFLSRYVSGKTISECLKYAAGYASEVCGRLGGF